MTRSKFNNLTWSFLIFLFIFLLSADMQAQRRTTGRTAARTNATFQAPSSNMKTKKLLLPFHKTPVDVSYEVMPDGTAVMEGDIILGKDSELQDLTGLNLSIVVDDESRRWKNGVVPYILSNSLSAKQTQDAKDAIAHVNQKTNVTMIPRTNQADYIEFKTHDGTACWSKVGKMGGRQTIRLEKGSCGRGTIIHEIGHALGLWHEQSRSDRDKYVNIHWENIEDGKASQFDKHIENGFDVGPYDYGSIMHYGKYSFDKNNKPTITPKTMGVNIGQRSGLSAGDIAAINKIYSTKPNGNPLPGYSQVAKHAVSISNYQALVNKHVGEGYMIDWADFYNVGSKVFVNVLFKPKSGKWLARHGLTSSGYQAVFDKYVPMGYKPHQVESYISAGKLRYAVIMVKSNDKNWKAYHGLSASDHQKRFNQYNSQGYKPMNVAVSSVGGKRTYVAFYTKESVGSWKLKSSLTSAQYQTEYMANKDAGRKLAYLCAYKHNGSVYFSAIWQKNAKGGAAKHGLSGSGYQQQFNHWTGKGYKTELVTGYGSGGSHKFAAKWSK